ncbi:hypothetical protein HHK36_021674 [Tetracentron sinense]|uniref:Uncharacterized protein n=1 Tax=Tetracentron sinense TaxID=13715 RepID=A0A834YTI5_TETSI|nr:hypothetical protein HHK36_021674 [Tetracentron sinense]
MACVHDHTWEGMARMDRSSKNSQSSSTNFEKARFIQLMRERETVLAGNCRNLSEKDLETAGWNPSSKIRRTRDVFYGRGRMKENIFARERRLISHRIQWNSIDRSQGFSDQNLIFQMASWLKAAEELFKNLKQHSSFGSDLFEVVDRRAKLVVNELSDEQSDSQPAASNEDSQARRTKPKEKAQKRLSTNEPPKTSDTAQELTSIQASEYNVTPNKDKVALSSENGGTMFNNPTATTSNEQQQDRDASISSLALSETLPNEVGKQDADHVMEVPASVNDVENATSSINGELANENTSDAHKGYPSSPFTATGGEAGDEDHPIDAHQITKFGDEDVSLKIDFEKSESESAEVHNNNDTHVKEADFVEEPLSDPKKLQEHKIDTSPKVQDQLDEAQGLLKSAISTGQSKEARLARVCAGLSSRLQEYKSENAQLEELLVAERERSNTHEARLKLLQKDLSASKIEVTRVESNMAEALAAKNSEIKVLISSMDALKKQAAVSEGKLASLQADTESIMRNRELTETRMMQALREELASAERRAEEERAAHHATKMAAMEREVELEQRAVESSTALARIQRIVDERTSRAAELEQKLALLEVECASLNQELQDMEARARRGQKRSPEEANQVLQAEVQKMRVEMAGMKRDAEHYSRQEHMELEKRYRELTDLLYYKQTQLEAMASEKAAAEFQLEKKVKHLQEAQVEAERSRTSRRVSSSWEEDTDLKALEKSVSAMGNVIGYCGSNKEWQEGCNSEIMDCRNVGQHRGGAGLRLQGMVAAVNGGWGVIVAIKGDAGNVTAVNREDAGVV